MATTTVTPAVAQSVYAVFCENISQDSVKRLCTSFSFATQNNIQHVHLMFQSSGGTVADGICLYNFIKALPIDLTMYNCGSVSSIAVLAYIAAKKRKAS